MGECNIVCDLTRVRSISKAQPRKEKSHRLAAIGKIVASNSKVTEEEISPCEKILVTYRNDFNIAKFHLDVLHRLSNRSDELQGLRRRYEALQHQSQRPQTLVERKSTLANMDRVQERINNLESLSKDEYQRKAQKIVSDYKRLGYRNISALESDEMEKEGDTLRSSLITSYLQVVSNYLNIEYIEEIPHMEECESCGCNLANTPAYLGLSMCPRCQSVRQAVIPASQKSRGSKSLSQKSDYEDKGNFWDAYLRFQCRVNFAPPKDMYTDLDIYFVERSYPCSDEIRALPLDANKRKEGTDLPLLLKALHDTGYNDYYKHYMAIAKEYWGWEPTNYSHLDALIIRDYEATQGVYKCLEKERSSSLSTELRVFLHIRVHDPNVRFDSFKIPGDPSSMSEQRKLWRSMCEGSDVPYISF